MSHWVGRASPHAYRFDCEDIVRSTTLATHIVLAASLLLAGCPNGCHNGAQGPDIDASVTSDGGEDAGGSVGQDDAGGAADSGSVADAGEKGTDAAFSDAGAGDVGPGTADAGTGDAGPGTADAGAGDAGTTTKVELAVSTTTDARPISPLIYGINPGKATCSNTTARFALCRLGGNPWTTYNWENNASNTGADSHNCSENSAQLGTSDSPADTVTKLIAEAGQSSAAAVVTLPIIDYVSADKLSGLPYPLCSGDVRQTEDYLTTRFKRNQLRKGSALSDPPDSTDGVVNQDEFVQFIKSRATGKQVLFTLDNQPDLWQETHKAVHPKHTTYQEVVERNTNAAKMLRENWPEAEITGYGGYGYNGFLTLQDAPNCPGDSVFLDYYLEGMKLASQAAGKRLIDYLDIHWYSSAQAGEQGVLTNDGTAALAEARVQAPRSLWDGSYSENSWISANNGPIRLIPWVQEKIDAWYPGTKLAISAWAYGGESSISGAIAVADALGIYGRSGVALAALDPIGDNVAFALGGFAVFRNYDGQGSAFGDTSVRATTSDVERVSVYASTDSKVSGRVVIVAINRSTGELKASLSVAASGSYSTADVYRLTDASPVPGHAGALSAVGNNLFDATLPPYSISVIVPRATK